MTTGGTPGANPNDPYGTGSGQQPGWNQPYGSQRFGQEPYPGQDYGSQSYGASAHGFGYPPAGGGGGPVTAGTISPTAAVGAGWNLFKSNPLPWVLIMLITFVANGVV